MCMEERDVLSKQSEAKPTTYLNLVREGEGISLRTTTDAGISRSSRNGSACIMKVGTGLELQEQIPGSMGRADHRSIDVL